MKWKQFKKPVLLGAAPLGLLAWMLAPVHENTQTKNAVECNNHHANSVCVMKTIFGFENLDTNAFVMPAAVKTSLKKGLTWIDNAQGNDGGWGSGSHYEQQVMDPHAVKSDPATTSTVCMGLLRSDNT